MKQKINLFYAEKKKFTLQLTFMHAVCALGIFVGILTIVASYHLYKHLTIKKELKVLGNQQKEKSQKLQVIAGQIPEEQTRNQLISEIKKYETEKQEKQQVLSLLISAQSIKIPGFSGYLEALSRRSIEGLWITQIHIKEDGEYISLEGRALKPDLVPKLITGLSSEAIFTGKTFQLFKIVEDEKTKHLSFVLETRTFQQP